MGAKTTYKQLKKGIRISMLIVVLCGLWPVFRANAHNGTPVVNEYLTSLLLLKDKVKTVCIDPGHGGHDPGCHGASVHEKNIALAIGLKLGRLINNYFPEVEVVFTRKTDVFVELHKRAEIANKANADLFICIHCNAGAPEAHGSETYALGLHKSEANLAVAKRENEAVLLEDNQEYYKGLNVNSPEGSIIMSMYQATFLNRSLSFAAKCQQYFVSDAGRNNRGVKQAGFLVLWRTAMPAVLIETGFLTNRNEEKYLMEPEGQDVMAMAIFKAFTDYKNEVEGTSVKPEIKASDIKRTDKGADEKTAREIPIVRDEPVKEGIMPKQNTDATDQPVFKVQFHSSGSIIAKPEQKFKGIENISYYELPSGYCYTSGSSSSLEEMKKLQDKIRSLGYLDAFVVAFMNGSRISVKDALDILKKKQ